MVDNYDRIIRAFVNIPRTVNFNTEYWIFLLQ